MSYLHHHAQTPGCSGDLVDQIRARFGKIPYCSLADEDLEGKTIEETWEMIHSCSVEHDPNAVLEGRQTLGPNPRFVSLAAGTGVPSASRQRFARIRSFQKRKEALMNCVDCGLGFYEYYTVHDAVWSEAGLHPDVHCCLGCLDRWLGRSLTIADFPVCAVNRMAYAGAGR